MCPLPFNLKIASTNYSTSANMSGSMSGCQEPALTTSGLAPMETYLSLQILLQGRSSKPSRKIEDIANACMDFEDLLSSGKFSDVIIVARNREFKAHKAILTSRSPVFAAMFEHDMTERNENKVNITDIGADAIQEVLRFIYTGKVKNLETLVDELLFAADKYSLFKLKLQCEKQLFKNMQLSTVFETLKIADRHDLHEVKEKALNFVASNASVLVNTEGFDRFFEGASLYKEVFAKLTSRVTTQNKKRRSWIFS